MSKFTLIAVIALGLLLVGASAVFAQNQTYGFGRSMMQFPAAPAPTSPGTSSGNTGTTPIGPGMMGYGPGTPGYGMMNGANYDAMRQALQSGDWQQMYDACQNAWQNSQNQPQTQSQPQTQRNQNQRSSTTRTPATRSGMMT